VTPLRDLSAPVVLLSTVLLLASLCGACADITSGAGGCTPGAHRCVGNTSLTCTLDGRGWVVSQDCTQAGKTCIAGKGCLVCDPGALSCKGQDVVQCNSTGSGYEASAVRTCDASKGLTCYSATCEDACKVALSNRSYVGCEYWAADLDNAVVSSGNAAAQQFAVALSNPSAMPARVKVTIDQAPVGAAPRVKTLYDRTLKPEDLMVLLLPSREVDGSPAGQFNTGGGTAITAQGFKITSTAPIIAYQFNPLSNAGVFSNDASLLVPQAALSTTAVDVGASYLVMGWPQTIATTMDPKTNSGDDLRAFLTIVGTRADTRVKVTLSTDIIGDKAGKVKAAKKGSKVEVKLSAYEVLNLETGGFGADFTGSRVDTDKPVVVFSGSEASDVPDFTDLTTRRCCADHLEHQLFPVTTLGTTFVALTTPSRTEALWRAGAQITVNKKEREYFRVLSAGEFVQVTTSLKTPDQNFAVANGKFTQLRVDHDFTLQATGPVVMGQFVASQDEAGVPSSLPGGDPSFILLPPVEQFRKDYLFLTPDKYSFDFVLVAAPKGARVTLDSRLLRAGCDSTRGKRLCCTVTVVGKVRRPAEKSLTEYWSYKCQLSYPTIVPGKVPPDNLLPGIQNDGVHRLKADRPVGLVVYGFDAYVSYGYPGGTDLALINLK